MMRIIRDAIIIISPFIIMIMVNEIVRSSNEVTTYSLNGITTINSASHDPLRCTWYCYNNTIWCKSNHVKYLNSYFRFTDPFYFGLIHFLMSTHNYAAANIILFIVLWPGLLIMLIFISLDLNKRIKQYKI
jgi:hypothetical protein